MAIPFYENEEQLHHQQQEVAEEIDQVDGPAIHLPYMTQNHQNVDTSQGPVSQPDLMAWKILALAMCKALKDHYHQNMASSGLASNSINTTSSSSSNESATAVIQILPNGQVKPQWN